MDTSIDNFWEYVQWQMHLLEEGVDNWGIFKKFMAMGMFRVRGFGVQGNRNFGVYRGKKRFFCL